MTAPSLNERRRGGRSFSLVVGLVLGVLLLAAHGGALRGGFHYDDFASVVDNPAVRSWQPSFYLTSPIAGSRDLSASGYRPVTLATFAVNYAVGRLDPRWYLLTNLLVHAGVSWLVFVVGRRLLGDARWAGAAAALYAIHPVNAEAVNYVVARSSTLATMGALAALWAFLHWWDTRKTGWLVASAAAFAVGLLSKESAIAFLAPL